MKLVSKSVILLGILLRNESSCHKQSFVFHFLSNNAVGVSVVFFLNEEHLNFDFLGRQSFIRVAIETLFNKFSEPSPQPLIEFRPLSPLDGCNQLLFTHFCIKRQPTRKHFIQNYSKGVRVNLQCAFLNLVALC